MDHLVNSLGFSAEAFPSTEAFLRSDALVSTSWLIADVQMPGMSGLELRCRLAVSGRRNSNHTDHGLSGRPGPGACAEGWGGRLLDQTFSVDELVVCIDAALAHRKGSSNNGWRRVRLRDEGVRCHLPDASTERARSPPTSRSGRWQPRSSSRLCATTESIQAQSMSIGCRPSTALRPSPSSLTPLAIRSMRRALMPIAEAALHGVRCWAARSLVRLARHILRGTVNLHRQGVIPMICVQAALWMTRILWRSGWVLLSWRRRHRKQATSRTG